MKITKVEVLALKIPRDVAAARGTAGSPTPLKDMPSEYRLAAKFPTLYSTKIETALVKIETDSGLTGWGEAQAPLAPEIVRTIVTTLLGPLLVGENPLAHERLWSRLYAAMRVRGHTGSFLLDAIAGLDMALWDLRGQALGMRVCDLLGGTFTEHLPAYISGLAGSDDGQRTAQAERYQQEGFDAFKLFLDGTPAEMLDLVDSLRTRLGPATRLMVDALWRLRLPEALQLGHELDARKTVWLEAPLPPEDVAGHARLAASIATAVALGECYRTRWEIRPFLDAGAVGVLQPDIGRCGLTEGMKLAALAEMHDLPVALHVSIGLGVQIAAALHLAASIPNLLFVEYNPRVYEVAASLLQTPLPVGPGTLGIPAGPGLGVTINEEALRPFVV